jgi:hypothetical protein
MNGDVSFLNDLVEALALMLWAAPPYLYAALGELLEALVERQQ